ncbi:hypothetical protein ASG99_07695 [Bacillus sp. Soil768D1]|nr:hypothetical protein ASG99_07695 [Bacillus sp. Soil768D1]
MEIKGEAKKTHLYCLFAIGLLLISFNNKLDILIISLIVICYFFLNLKNNFYMYIFLMPFDEILVIPMLGSIYRLLQLIIIFKFCYLTLKQRLDIKFNIVDIFLLLFLTGYIFCSIIIYRDINVLGLIINILIVIMLKQSISQNFVYHLTKIFKLFIFSTLIAIFWGLIHQNFILGGDQFISMMRFSGTQEPNVMALYINISILFLLYLKWELKKKAPLFILLYIGLFLTVSMSGFMLNSIIICLFFLLNKNTFVNIKASIKYFFILLLFILSIIILKDHLSVLDIPLARLQEKINYVLEGNLNSATTGRTELSNRYFNEYKQLDVHQKILGIFTFNNNNILTYFKLNKMNVSHNTYIDMLFSFGILGMIVFFGYVFRTICLNIKTEYFKCLLILKIVLIVSGFTLSMFSSRYFYVWMIL